MTEELFGGRECLFDLSKTIRLKFGRAIQAVHGEILHPSGLSGKHAPYLLFLSESAEGATLADCSRVLNVDRANTTRVIRELVEKGYVMREDGVKKFRVALTAGGRALGSALSARVRLVREKILSDLSAEEVDFLFRILGKMEKCV